MFWHCIIHGLAAAFRVLEECQPVMKRQHKWLRKLSLKKSLSQVSHLEMFLRNQSLRQAVGPSPEERLRRRVPRLHQRHRHHVQGE